MTEVILITLLVVALFYVFFVRPARTEESRRRQDLTELEVGDVVLTRGGLIAEVEGVETPEDGPMVVLLRLSEDVVVRARTLAIEERIERAAVEVGADQSNQSDQSNQPTGGHDERE